MTDVRIYVWMDGCGNRCDGGLDVVVGLVYGWTDVWIDVVVGLVSDL